MARFGWDCARASAALASKSAIFSEKARVLDHAAVHIVAETPPNQLFCVATLGVKCQGFRPASQKSAFLAGFERFSREARSRSIKN
jgi:hypothetical protein